MNLEVVFQLAALLLIVACGPITILLLSLRGGNI